MDGLKLHLNGPVAFASYFTLQSIRLLFNIAGCNSFGRPPGGDVTDHVDIIDLHHSDT